MESRWAATSEFLDTCIYLDGPGTLYAWDEDKLAPVQERVQKMYWDSKRGIWDVKLVPHWSTAYCPYPNELCDCSTQTTNKIGHWYIDSDHEDYPLRYQPRKGYEEVEPLLQPSRKEYNKRL